MNQLLETPAQAAALLQKQDRIMIILHRLPDCDTIGSGAALCAALRSLGKEAILFCKDEIPPLYREIFPDITVYHPGTGLPFEPQYLVSVDIASPNLFGKGMEAYSSLTDLCIDHHSTNTCYAKKLLLGAHFAANCEIIFEVIVSLGAAITPEIATYLYCGIATDTGCFKFPNVIPHTFETAARLLRLGANAAKISYYLFETKSEERIKLEQYALSHLELYFEGRCGLFVLPKAVIEQTGASEGDLDGLSNIAKIRRGIQAAVMLQEMRENVYKISFRTTQQSGIDAGVVCAMLGGGGHEHAAGCSVKADAQTAKEMILKAISIQGCIAGGKA